MQPEANLRTGGIHLKAEYFFANQAMLSSTTAYRNSSNAILHDNDYSAVDLIHTEYQDSIGQLTQELRYQSAENTALRYNLGLYFSKENNTNDSKAILGNDTNTLVTLPSIGVPLPFNVVFGVSPNTVLPLKGTVSTETAALFGSADYQLNDNMQWHTGARLSHETKQLKLFMDGRQSGLLNMATIDNGRDAMTNTFFSPMLGFSYHPVPQTQFYCTLAKSYKNGGWNVEMVTQTQAEDGLRYQPESVNSVEFGVKSKVQQTELHIAAFRNDLKNYQVFQYTNLGGSTLMLQLRNAAQARTQGLEFNLNHAINEALSLQASLGYLDAKYLSFPQGRANGQEAAGDALPDAPRWSGSLSTHMKQHFELAQGTIELTLQQYFQSSTMSGASNDAAINHLEGRGVQDASILYYSDNKKWQWAFWVKNLTNKQYAFAKSNDAFLNVYAIYAEPRLYGLSAQYFF